MFAYYTTIWTPYHETICRELANRLGGDFRLVLTQPVESGGHLGWDLRPPDEPWIVAPPESHGAIENGAWVKLIMSADMAVLGALYGHRALFRAADERVRSGKITVFMGERPFKRGLRGVDFLKPYNWYVWWRLHRRYNRPNVHFLAIGNGVREDLAFLRVHKATVRPWAYFPAVSPEPTVKTPSGFLRICWCGRMIACKHVEVLLHALALLPADVRAKCRATVAGEGVMRATWVALAQRLHLDAVVTFAPMLSHDRALALMAESDVYVFPSDGEEGWGVALEEAMDKCCVPIACAAAGAPGALIEDGVSGFLVQEGDASAVAGKIVWLMDNPGRRASIGEAAWRSVQRHSPRIGAEQLMSVR